MNQNSPPLPGVSAPPSRSSALAITSLVFGILGVTCFSILAGIPAIICGHLARGKIRRSAGMLEGNGFALAGLIMGYLSFALLVIAIPNFIKARGTAMQNSTNRCISNLRLLDGAVQQWAVENKKSLDAQPTWADLEIYLKAPVVCPAGGTSSQDSYALRSPAESPICIAPRGGKSHGHVLPP